MAIKLNYVLLDDQKVAKLSLDGLLENDEKVFSELTIPEDFELNLHLGQLQGINSLGVRTFINWSSALKNAKIFIYDAPKCFIDQLNMVSGFVPPQTRVRSFFVPYYSEATDEEFSVLLSLGINFYLFEDAWKFSFPEIMDSNGQPMGVDIQSDRYFRFLEKMK